MKSRYLVRQSDVTPYSPANHTGTKNYRLIGKDTVGAKQVEMLIGEVERGKGAIVHACFNCNKILCWRCYWRHEPECYERRGGISGKEGSD